MFSNFRERAREGERERATETGRGREGEREREIERERHTHINVRETSSDCSHTCPDWGSNPQPFDVRADSPNEPPDQGLNVL